MGCFRRLFREMLTRSKACLDVDQKQDTLSESASPLEQSRPMPLMPLASGQVAEEGTHDQLLQIKAAGGERKPHKPQLVALVVFRC